MSGAHSATPLDQKDDLPPQVGTAIARGRRPDLQGMRAVAVLAVFADHLFGWPSGGFVGVDVFFVLSGFFITGLLIRERTATGTLSFQDFYVRRIKRILPSAMLVLIATVAASQLLFPATRAKETFVDALYASVFAANFRFEAIGADYFQQDQPPSPLQHYWSLSIEEQFYFVWPVLLVLIFSLTRGIRRRGNRWVRQWALICAMGVVVATSFGWATYLSADNPNAAYFSTFTRVWELGVGALVAIAGPWLAQMPSAIRPILAYLGLTGVLGSLFLIDSSVQFPAPWAALPVLSTALVIASFQDSPVRGMFPLTNPVARYFGDTSYTLYLWHWPVITLLLTMTPKGPIFYGVALSLTLGLTAVTYRFYEDPIRKSDWLLDKPVAKEVRTIFRPGRSEWALIGALMVTVVVVSILGIRYDEKVTIASQGADELTADQPAPLLPEVGPLKTPPSQDGFVPRIVPLPGVGPCFGAPAIVDTSCMLRDPDVPLKPSIDNFAKDGKGPSCWNKKDEPVKSCTFGYEGVDATRIALVGDSHANRLLKGLVPSLDELKWHITTYIGWGCEWKDHPEGSCEQPMSEVQKELLANPYDLVLTTSSRKIGGPPADFARSWSPVAAAGSRIAAVADNPGVSKESLACLTRVRFGDDRTGDCGTPIAEAFAKPDPLIAAAQLVPAATLIDLTPYYCIADRCPSIIGDVIVYADEGAHLTATYIRTLSPAIVDGVRHALGE